MSDKKQVIDMRSSTAGISTNESNEQQRKWDDVRWMMKASDSLANYDPTRSHLNFEVTKGGVVQAIDTSKTIGKKMEESLRARGIVNPNERPNKKRLNRVLAQFIIGGNQEEMRKLAFGDQDVDFGKRKDNSEVVRNKDIEEWAKDVYRFMAKKYGEENIVSFYVHCDELNPHAHCTVLPVKDNRLSYRAVFGKNIHEESVSMSILHDEFYDEVGKKWGLERGDNMAETKAKHRSTAEFKRDLVREVNMLQNTIGGLRKEIQKAERKLKGLSTMLGNLQQRREEILREVDDIARQFDVDGNDTEALAKRMQALRGELKCVDGKIAMRQQMLDDTNDVLDKANARLQQLLQQERLLGEDIQSKKATGLERDIMGTYNKMVMEAFEPVRPTLTYQQNDILDRSGYNDLTEHPREIFTCALHLAMGYVREATRYVESHGGSSGNMGGWGRGKDEDDEDWWRRCIGKSAEMMKGGRRKVRRR